MAVLEQFNAYVDERGVVYSPLIERGSDNIPKFVNVPSLEDLKGFSSKKKEDVVAMSKLLHQFGFPPPDQMVDQQKSFLAAFDITPDSPRYEQAMLDLKNGNSGRFLLAQSRRTQEQYQTMSSIRGNTEHEMVRLAESDEPCDRCDPLDGEQKKYSEFVAANELPGGSSCEGGNNCLCTMWPVKRK